MTSEPKASERFEQWWQSSMYNIPDETVTVAHAKSAAKSAWIVASRHPAPGVMGFSEDEFIQVMNKAKAEFMMANQHRLLESGIYTEIDRAVYRALAKNTPPLGGKIMGAVCKQHDSTSESRNAVNSELAAGGTVVPEKDYPSPISPTPSTVQELYIPPENVGKVGKVEHDNMVPPSAVNAICHKHNLDKTTVQQVIAAYQPFLDQDVKRLVEAAKVAKLLLVLRRHLDIAPVNFEEMLRVVDEALSPFLTDGGAK